MVTKWRPVAFAISPTVSTRSTFEANVVITTRPFCSATSFCKLGLIDCSEGEASLLKTLVLSPIIARTPFLPIVRSAASLAGPATVLSGSSFQSPV